MSTLDLQEIGKRKSLFEVLVFLFLILPSMALSFLVVKQGTLSFPLTAIATILRDGALVCLILYFLWCNQEKLSGIGWKPAGIGREVAIGVLLFVPTFFVTGALARVLQSLGFSAPATPLPSALSARGPGEMLLAVLLVIVVALSEETIFRGYLIHRLERVTGSWPAAALLSSLVFSLGHGYEGTAGVVTVGVMGLIFASVYRWRGSLVAPVAMHFMQDAIGIIVLPLLGRAGS